MKTFTSFVTLATLAAFESPVIANGPLATLTPCPEAPEKGLAPITVTSQYQTVSACEPSTACIRQQCSTIFPLTTYKYVSTVIPYAWDGTTSQSTTVTNVKQLIRVSEHLETITKSSPTAAPVEHHWDDWSTTDPTQTTDVSPAYETVYREATAPYDQIGPIGVPGWDGSGLCQSCLNETDGTATQLVGVFECRHGTDQSGQQYRTCIEWHETWVAYPAASPTVTVGAETYSAGDPPSVSGPTHDPTSHGSHPQHSSESCDERPTPGSSTFVDPTAPTTTTSKSTTASSHTGTHSSIIHSAPPRSTSTTHWITHVTSTTTLPPKIYPPTTTKTKTTSMAEPSSPSVMCGNDQVVSCCDTSKSNSDNSSGGLLNIGTLLDGVLGGSCSPLSLDILSLGTPLNKACGNNVAACCTGNQSGLINLQCNSINIL